MSCLDSVVGKAVVLVVLLIVVGGNEVPGFSEGGGLVSLTLLQVVRMTHQCPGFVWQAASLRFQLGLVGEMGEVGGAWVVVDTMVGAWEDLLGVAHGGTPWIPIWQIE